jgi:hypothetical protein
VENDSKKIRGQWKEEKTREKKRETGQRIRDE